MPAEQHVSAVAAVNWQLRPPGAHAARDLPLLKTPERASSPRNYPEAGECRLKRCEGGRSRFVGQRFNDDRRHPGPLHVKRVGSPRRGGAIAAPILCVCFLRLRMVGPATPVLSGLAYRRLVRGTALARVGS
jgi:hypothetical protein